MRERREKVRERGREKEGKRWREGRKEREARREDITIYLLAKVLSSTQF